MEGSHTIEVSSVDVGMSVRHLVGHMVHVSCAHVVGILVVHVSSQVNFHLRAKNLQVTYFPSNQCFSRSWLFCNKELCDAKTSAAASVGEGGVPFKISHVWLDTWDRCGDLQMEMNVIMMQEKQRPYFFQTLLIWWRWWCFALLNLAKQEGILPWPHSPLAQPVVPDWSSGWVNRMVNRSMALMITILQSMMVMIMMTPA